MKQIEIVGRQVWVHQTTEKPEWVIIQPMDEHDQQGLDEEIAWLSSHSSATFTLVAFSISNRNAELSPWKAPAVFGLEDFGDGASKTLCYVPQLTHNYVISKSGNELVTLRCPKLAFLSIPLSFHKDFPVSPNHLKLKL